MMLTPLDILACKITLRLFGLGHEKQFNSSEFIDSIYSPHLQWHYI